MKKLLLLISLCLLCTACAGKKPAEELPPVIAPQQQLTADSSVDVDLSVLSSTMVYAEDNAMMTQPEDYVGKLVKMNGTFAVYVNSENGRVYYACVIQDATACCAQGLEFVLADEEGDAYPSVGSNLTVIGRYELYEEDGYNYCHMVDAKIV